MLAAALVLGRLANTGLEGCTSVLLPLATGTVSGVTWANLNFMRTHGSCAALPQSCSLTVPLSLQVENIQPIGVSDAPEVLAASTELGPEDSAGSSSEEDAPDVDSGDAQKPEDVSSGDGSEQEAEVEVCWSGRMPPGYKLSSHHALVFSRISRNPDPWTWTCGCRVPGSLGQLCPQVIRPVNSCCYFF